MFGTSWTPEEDALLVRLRREGKLFSEIAASLPGRSEGSCSQRFKRFATASPNVTGRSLAQFARDKRREGCPVCDLAQEIREQLRKASTQKITRETQLEWLRVDHGVKLTLDELNAHAQGRHDVEG